MSSVAPSRFSQYAQQGAITLVAVAAVGALYGTHLPFSRAVYPATIAASLVVAIAFGTKAYASAAPRQGGIGGVIGLGCLSIAVIGMWLATFASFGARELAPEDLGLFFFQAIVPILIVLVPQRVTLLERIGALCAACSIADALVNIAALFGAIDLQLSSRLIDGGEVRLRYPGLSGNTHAAGLIGLIGVIYLLTSTNTRRLARGAAFTALIVGLVALSIYLADARRYLVFGGACVLLYVFRNWLPLVAYPAAALLLGSGLLLATFLTFDVDVGNAVRAELLTNGLAKALSAPVLGSGPTYLALSDVVPELADLIAVGATESQLLDLAINYGVPTAFALLIAALCALGLGARQQSSMLGRLLLLCLTAELFIGGSLRGYLGSVVLYAAMLALLLNDRVLVERKLLAGPS